MNYIIRDAKHWAELWASQEIKEMPKGLFSVVDLMKPYQIQENLRVAKFISETPITQLPLRDIFEDIPRVTPKNHIKTFLPNGRFKWVKDDTQK